MIDQVRTISHELRLFGIHSSAERLAQVAAAQGLHHLEFLRLVLEEEKLARQTRVAKSLTTRVSVIV